MTRYMSMFQFVRSPSIGVFKLSRFKAVIFQNIGHPDFSAKNNLIIAVSGSISALELALLPPFLFFEHFITKTLMKFR